MVARSLIGVMVFLPTVAASIRTNLLNSNPTCDPTFVVAKTFVNFQVSCLLLACCRGTVTDVTHCHTLLHERRDKKAR